MSRIHVALGSMLAFGAIALTVSAVWVGGQPRYLCDEGIHDPNGWKYVAFLLFALVLPALVFLGTRYLYDNATVQRVYIAVAIGEAAISVALAIYLNGKWTGNYHCG